MGELLTPTHLMVIAIVGVVLFAGKKLPELGRGLGEGFCGFKDGIKALAEEPNHPRADPAAKTECGEQWKHREAAREVLRMQGACSGVADRISNTA
jgi:sec-independent protein translocase protein TatA